MNRPATKNTISDIVIATVNRLRAGDVPAELLALLTEMRDNCGDEPMVTSVGGAIHRYTVKADVEAARATVLRAGAALPALAKSIPLCGVAHDIVEHLQAHAPPALDAATVLGIAGRYLVPRGDPVLATSVVFTSGACLRVCGDGDHAPAARHIVSSLLIDDTSPQHNNRSKIYDPRFNFVCCFCHIAAVVTSKLTLFHFCFVLVLVFGFFFIFS